MKVKNRWFMALAAMAIHICIGSVYAWSVYVNPMSSTMNWILTDVTITFSVAIFFLGLSAALMDIFNGTGRIVWASISDYLTRPIVFILFFVTQIIAFYMLTTVKSILLFQVLLYYIMMCYGGAFASIPAYIGDIFGTKKLGAIHGYILTAWALAGLVGPIIIAYVKDTTGSYTDTLYVFIGLFVVALITSLLMLANIKKIKTSQIQA
ncbi:MAG: hypothetical protein KC427_01585 [Sulfurovum sp.]|nr:hypothetical protein [Sulfurovum sp.]